MGPNYLLMAGAAIGGIVLLLVVWGFISNAQFGLTLLAVKETSSFFPFVGTLFLYTIGFYFVILFIAVVSGVIYVETHPPEQSLPVQ
jgi:hypothetical protein